MEQLAVCPNCHSHFHFNHLQTWIKKQQTCPYCHKSFSREFVAYFLADPSMYEDVPLYQDPSATIITQQQDNIVEFTKFFDEAELEQRVAQHQCIVCGAESSRFTHWGTYPYCSYAHLETVHPMIIWAIGLPVLFALSFVFVGFINQWIVGILALLFVLYLFYRYLSIRTRSDHIRYLVGLKADEELPYKIASVLGSAMMVLLYFFVWHNDLFQ